jgi:hypothetical protein
LRKPQWLFGLRQQGIDVSFFRFRPHAAGNERKKNVFRFSPPAEWKKTFISIILAALPPK